jgi:hypothetical protein
MNDHPDADNPEAPLFVSLRPQDKGKRLSGHSIYTMLSRIVEDTTIDPDRVHPHAFRHARATAMRTLPNFSKSDVETVMGWTDSTPMHSRYTHATSTEEAKRTARKMGLEVGEEDERAIKMCPRCDNHLPPQSRYCPTCALRIDESAPAWWDIYSEIAKETDPILKEYDALPTTVPELEDLPPQDLDHIHDILILAEGKMMDTEQGQELPHPYDGVTAYESEEEADEANKIRKQIENILGEIYEESPERIQNPKINVDESDVESYMESNQAKESKTDD